MPVGMYEGTFVSADKRPRLERLMWMMSQQPKEYRESVSHLIWSKDGTLHIFTNKQLISIAEWTSDFFDDEVRPAGRPKAGFVYGVGLKPNGTDWTKLNRVDIPFEQNPEAVKRFFSS